MSVARYNARTAELRWQQTWQQAWDSGELRSGPAASADPSGCTSAGTGLRDIRACTMADVFARYKRARGFDVPPEGDVFRTPAGMPGSQTGATAGTALRSLGLSHGWSRERATFDTVRHRPAAGPATSEPFDLDPGEVIDTYGADATRWFVLSDSPPDRDLIWSEPGLRGAWRFVQRLWRLINSAAEISKRAPATAAALSGRSAALRRSAHRASAQISANIERRRLNVCVAHIHTFARALEAVVAESSEPAGPDLKFAAREAAKILVQLFHPMMPHLAEECWTAVLGHENLLATQSWPALEAGLLDEDTVTLAVHVNGTRRADVTVARDARNGDIEASALALDAIRRVLDGKAPRKVIIVPQRIINVVA
jgi:leucyl-tRNA synthetase